MGGPSDPPRPSSNSPPAPQDQQDSIRALLPPAWITLVVLLTPFLSDYADAYYGTVLAWLHVGQAATRLSTAFVPPRLFGIR